MYKRTTTNENNVAELNAATFRDHLLSTLPASCIVLLKNG